MKNEKKIELLSNKAEIIIEIIKTTIEELKEIESNVKQVEGFAFGVKETADKLEGYIKKHKTEIFELEKEGKIQKPIVLLLNSAAENILKFVKDNSKEAEKLHYIRQGEILGIKGKINRLKISYNSTKDEIQSLEAEDNVLAIQASIIKDDTTDEMLQKEPVTTEKKTQEVKTPKTRPDKNPNTKIGKAALDLAERRKKAQDTSNNVPKKRGRKPQSF
jgi:hypothetical protein